MDPKQDCNTGLWTDVTGMWFWFPEQIKKFTVRCLKRYRLKKDIYIREAVQIRKKIWVVVMQNIMMHGIKEFQDLYSYWQNKVNYTFSLIEPLIAVRLHRHGKIKFCYRKDVFFLRILFSVSDLVCRQCFWDRGWDHCFWISLDYLYNLWKQCVF